MANKFIVLNEEISFEFYGSGFTILVIVTTKHEADNPTYTRIDYTSRPKFTVTDVIAHGCEFTLEEIYNAMGEKQLDSNLYIQEGLSKTSWTVRDLLSQAIRKQGNTCTEVHLSKQDALDLGIEFDYLKGTLTKLPVEDSKITIPSTIGGVVVEYLDERLLENKSLDEITLPSSLKGIGEFAFADNNLKEIKFPSTLEVIGECAFVGNQLTSVVIPKRVHSLGFRAFDENKIKEVKIWVERNVKIGDAIFDSSTGDLTVSCYKDSKAEEYAKKCGYNIKHLEEGGLQETTSNSNLNSSNIFGRKQ